jgi:hypothetical protein
MRRDAFSLLATNNVVQAAEAASNAWGLYGVGNTKADENWKSLTENLLVQIDSKTTSIATVNALLAILARNNVSIGSFWSGLFEEKIDPKIKEEKTRLSDLIKMMRACNQVDFRSETVSGKLVSGLLENETVWIVSPEELVQVTETVADSFLQSRQLFSEIGNRVLAEMIDFQASQLIAIIEAFAKINFSHEEMLREAFRKFVQDDEFDKLTPKEKVRLADAASKLRFRSDTFFKKLACEAKDWPVEKIASLCVAVQKLKMHVGGTEWWNRESDFHDLVNIIKDQFTPETIKRMTAKDIAHCVRIVKNNGKLRVSNSIMVRLQYLLTQDPLSRSHRHVALICEALARGGETGAVHVDNLRWMAEWLCSNLYILPVHDIAVINRSISKLGFRDHNYHKIWIPYYLERLSELTKEDISSISDNFNDIGMSDTQMGGRHFFYKLGKRFQELSVETNGDKELTVRKKYRNIQRLG